MKEEVWIGLAGIKPGIGENILGDDIGGFVNILLMARSTDDYCLKVKQFLKSNNLELLELSDVERFLTRMEQYEVEEKLIYLAEVVRRKGTPQFGTLHTYNK